MKQFSTQQIFRDLCFEIITASVGKGLKHHREIEQSKILVLQFTYIYIFQAGLKRVLEIRVRTELGFRAKSLRADYYQRLARNQPDFSIYRFFRFFIIVTLRIKLQ